MEWARHRPVAGMTSMSAHPRDGMFDASVTSHHTFICGDLNFRVSLPSGVPDSKGSLEWEGRPRGEHMAAVQEMVKNRDWSSLYKADELQRALKMGECLSGFHTLPCNFHPTFKLQREEGFHYQETRTPRCVF